MVHQLQDDQRAQFPPGADPGITKRGVCGPSSMLVAPKGGGGCFKGADMPSKHRQ